MTDNPSCELCGALMTKVGDVNSGNASYVTYRCPTCHKERTTCLGINE